MTSSSLRLRARWVLPIDAPPIRDGEVAVENGRIVSVGPAGAGGCDRDFGDAALLPGFVNVHTHLEYTVFRGFLEDIDFFRWIRTLTARKAALTARDWETSALCGAAEMLAAGVTTVGDCADAGATLPALVRAGLRGVVYREVFGITEEEPLDRIVAALAGKVEEMRADAAAAPERIDVGISPHAPYTIRAPLFGALGERARREGWRQAIHVAESSAEVALIGEGTGPFAEMFARRGIDWRAAGVSPVRYVAAQGGFDAPTLAVHCVHVDAEDARLLAEKDVAVAHCPKSNGKLGAGIAPLRLLLDAGVAVGLGTDSVASNNSVDLFEEMRAAVYNARALSHAIDALTARAALGLATLGGARALDMEGRIGSLTPGKQADLCAVRLDGLHIAPADDDPVAALVYSARASDVVFTMVEGRVCYDASATTPFPLMDVTGPLEDLRAMRRRLKETNIGA